MKIKKILKRLSITIGVLLVLVLITISIALNFVFTPEKITPTVTDLLNENLDAKVSCERIELTFFSSFPHFGVKLTNGNVVTASIKGRKNDTLAQFDMCRASFNIDKLLRKHNLVVNNLTITNPKVKAVIHKNGKANWNIVKETGTDTIAEDSTAFKINSIFVKKLTVENASIAYHDFVTKAHAKADSLFVTLKAANTDDKLVFSTETSGKHIKFSKDGYRFANNLKAALTTKILYDKKNQKVDFDKSELKLNDIDFVTEGHFKRDTITHEVQTDLILEMKVPSLKTLWETVPEYIIKKEDIDVRGNVVLKATAKGIYSKDRLPLTDITFKIDNGVLKYNKFAGEIRHLEGDLHALLNFDKPEASILTIKQLLLEGTGVDLKGNATVTNLLKDPEIDSNIKGDLDLTTLKKKFPFAKDIEAKGLAHIDINAVFKSNDIMNSNFNNMKVKGNSLFTNLLINDPKDTIYVQTKKTELVFGRKAEDEANRKSFGKIAATDLTVNYKNQHNIKLAGLDVKLRAKKQRDSMSKLAAEIRLTNLKYSGSDKIRGVIRKASITAELSPRSTKGRPAISTTFTVDSAGVWQDKKFVGIKNGNYKLLVQKNRDSIWMPRGYVEFNNLYAYTPEFALPLRMEHSKISINNRAITLRNAHIFFGNSDVTLTGQINNMLAKKSPDKKVDATLTLTSNFIDANEIMAIMNTETAAKEQQPDFKQVAEHKLHDPKNVSNKKTVFKIPANINFVFNSDIKKLHYGTLDLQDLKGVLKVEEGHLKLNHFELTTLAAKLTTSLNYSVVNDRRAKVDFDLNLHDIEMANIAKVMPAMDSLFPMTKSFVGKGHLRMQGSALLNRRMDVIIPSVTSIAALQATDIMVLDGETFKEMAKTLMFKQKDKNTINTLNMEMIIEKSHMEVLPALVEIDRYTLAVGGMQNLDMSYNYHVSVLKSPIPFKTGVDIKGSNLDDYKISLTKAKYKYYFTDKERLKEKADESIINKKKDILAKLEFN
ncbi:AsmA-like C-terminal region-containing protein [Flavobacterium psychrotrophum]|uniref:AsmA-like C-terminal region-containing protein n=1 Tax=Flavobacterium psychrotrophum TaxID=2294119 RepID=UPI000E321670|nr:AsmA-like C-terminal region-containing protein [Flavobacterium psychrotrophum]